MARWSWIMPVVMIVFAISPLGQDLIHNAFFSGEQLSRNIAQPVLAMIVAGLVLLWGLEWLIRRLLRRRSRPQTPP